MEARGRFQLPRQRPLPSFFVIFLKSLNTRSHTHRRVEFNLRCLFLPFPIRSLSLEFRPFHQQRAMNIFRFAGDMTHLLSILVLLLKIYATKSCSDFFSLYNTSMKLVFIASSLAIVWCMRGHRLVRRTYDKEIDTFRHYFLVLGCFVLALFLNEKFTVQEVLWAFSIYLEAVAIIPQLVLLQRSGNVDNLTGQYVFFLGAYRAFYILNWIYRYFTEARFSRWIACISGLVQTALYADFFYYYFISWKNNAKLQLPA